MAINVDNQYHFKFSLQGNEDFIDEESLEKFTLIEDAGNTLPTFEMVFRSRDEKILALLNEGNDLEVSFGKSRNELTDIKLVVTKLQSQRLGLDSRTIYINGVLSALPYLSNTNNSITDKKSGIEVIKEIANKYFTTNFNVETSNDKQNWINHSIPDKSFVNDIWLHSYIPNSFIAIGISSDGTLILKDIKKELRQPYRWKFTHNIIDQNRDVYYDGDYIIESSTGFINTWLGYGREKSIYNIDDGATELISEDIKPFLAQTKAIARRAELEKRFADVGLLNENVHSNYWRAYLRNLTSLAIFSSVTITFSFHNIHLPIKVLDLVSFKDTDIQDARNREASEYQSGLYLVSKISRTIQNRQYVTTIQLNRESFNSLSGDLR